MTALSENGPKKNAAIILLNDADGKRRFWKHIEQLRQMRIVQEVCIRRENRHKVNALVIDSEYLEYAPNTKNY